tara:strand:+ start:2278 stop:2445 length:168 start_codon:yes stop_codon:yes gene_type:complete
MRKKKETKEERKARIEKIAKLFQAIEILCELDEKELAYQLRAVSDTNFLPRNRML